METLKDFRKKRNKQLVDDFNRIFVPGMKLSYVYGILAKKYGVHKSSVKLIVDTKNALQQ